MSRLVHGKQFLAWLSDNGIVPERTRRVVIDAAVNAAVMVYTEQFGDERLIDVRLLDPGVEVRVIEVSKA